MSEKKKNAKDIINAMGSGEMKAGEVAEYEHAGATGTMLKVDAGTKTSYDLLSYNSDGEEIAHVHGENMECAFVIAVPEDEHAAVHIEGLISPHHLKIAGIAFLSYLDDFGLLHEILLLHAMRKLSGLAGELEENGAFGTGLPFSLRGFGDFDPSSTN